MIYVFLMFSALVGGTEGEVFCCTDRAAGLGEGDCIKLL